MYERHLDDLRERQDFINGLDIPAREMEMFLQTLDEGEEITMTDRDLLISATLESEVPGIGRLEMQKLTLTHLEGKELLGRKFTLQVSAGQRDSLGQLPPPLTLGTFYVVSSEKIKDKDEVKVTAYNQTHALTAEYKPELFTYPTTANELLQQICGVLDIIPTMNQANIDIDIEQDLYKNIHGIQYREIIEELAALTGSIARFNNRGDLEFWCANDLEGETDECHVKIPDGALIKLTELEKYGAVNSLVLARSPQNDNVAETEPGANPIIEATITNNQIIDKRREAVKAKLFPYFKGLTYYPFEAETSGVIGALVGDIVEINGKRSVVMGRKLTLDGGIKENLWCKDPARTKINYNRTSNIDKRIKNTELYVDKQEQVIRGVVSDVQTLGNTVNDNHTEITQKVREITNKIQRAGGNNLLRNSAFFYKSKEKPDDTAAEPNLYKPWEEYTLSSPSIIDVAPSAEAKANGGISGNNLFLRGRRVSQTVKIRRSKITDTEEERGYYTLSCLIKKSALGIAGMLVRTATVPTENLCYTQIGEGESAFYKRLECEPFYTTASNDVIVEIWANGDAEATFTDIMLTHGRSSANWEQASGEAMSTSVTMNEYGLIVKSDIYDGAYTAMTPLEFSGYAESGGSQQRVFTVNGERTIVTKFSAKDEIALNPIKQIAIKTGSIKGIAFIDSGEED